MGPTGAIGPPGGNPVYTSVGTAVVITPTTGHTNTDSGPCYIYSASSGVAVIGGLTTPVNNLYPAFYIPGDVGFYVSSGLVSKFVLS